MRFFRVRLIACLQAICLSTCLAVNGCSSPKTPPAGTPRSENTKTSPSTTNQLPDSKTDLDTAKEKLTIALDSWVFGDSSDELKKAHPDIVFLNAPEYLVRTPKQIFWSIEEN